jgi:hypothetical protein
MNDRDYFYITEDQEVYITRSRDSMLSWPEPYYKMVAQLLDEGFAEISIKAVHAINSSWPL